MSILMKNSLEMLNATVTASQNGSAITLQDNYEGFGAVFKASSMTGTSPTYDMKIQHSHNGTDWFDLSTFAQLTADGSEYKAITGEVMEFVRYVLVVGGTTPSAALELNFAYNDKRRND